MKYVSILLMLLVLITALSAQSISETLVQIQAAKTEYDQNLQIVEQKIAELRSSNPLFSPQDAFESDFEYMARLCEASPQIERIRKQYLDDVRLKLNKLRSSTWETSNITVTFGKYEPNYEIWNISVKHNEHQMERYELKQMVERATAKSIYDNQNRLIVKGILTLDVADRISLAKLMIQDPVTSFGINTNINPVLRYNDTIAGFSPDDKFIAAIRGNKALVFNLETSQQVVEFGHKYSLTSVVFSPDGKLLATGFGDDYYGGARVFDLETYQQIVEFEHIGNVYSVAFSPDGKYLATGCKDGNARIFNLESRQQIREFRHGWGSCDIYCVAFSPDGKLLATASGYDSIARESELVTLIDLQNRLQIDKFDNGYGEVFSVAFSPDSEFLATGCYDNKARIFNLSTKKETASYDYGEYVAWSPIGSYLATSGKGKTQIINTSTGTQHYLYDVEGVPVFSPDGRFLAIGDAIYRTFITVEGAEPE